MVKLNTTGYSDTYSFINAINSIHLITMSGKNGSVVKGFLSIRQSDKSNNALNPYKIKDYLNMVFISDTRTLFSLLFFLKIYSPPICSTNSQLFFSIYSTNSFISDTFLSLGSLA